MSLRKRYTKDQAPPQTWLSVQLCSDDIYKLTGFLTGSGFGPNWLVSSWEHAWTTHAQSAFTKGRQSCLSHSVTTYWLPFKGVGIPRPLNWTVGAGRKRGLKKYAENWYTLILSTPNTTKTPPLVSSPSILCVLEASILSLEVQRKREADLEPPHKVGVGDWGEKRLSLGQVYFCLKWLQN